MKKWSVCVQMVHHTKDEFCVSMTVSKGLPAFIVEASTQEEAEEMVMRIVKPFDLDYEQIDAHVSVAEL